MSLARIAIYLLTSSLFATTVLADVAGVVSTDRFGYAGTTVRYATLADALSASNPLQTINIVERDLSIFQVWDVPSYYTNANITGGSWWYTTDPSGTPGFGNTHGNTGVGLVQIYEDPASTATSFTTTSRVMEFQNFNGTFFTDYRLTVTGVNATPATSLARFSPFVLNTNDSGTYLNYKLDLLATGLQGTITSSTLIESTNHPTGVTGIFSGLFENPTADPTKKGFYTFSLNLTMDNWAYTNRDNLTYPTTGFADSYFAQAIPEPVTAFGLLAVSLALPGFKRFRRNG